jgi:hypothetical protein
LSREKGERERRGEERGWNTDRAVRERYWVVARRMSRISVADLGRPEKVWNDQASG